MRSILVACAVLSLGLLSTGCGSSGSSSSTTATGSATTATTPPGRLGAASPPPYCSGMPGREVHGRTLVWGACYPSEDVHPFDYQWIRAGKPAGWVYTRISAFDSRLVGPMVTADCLPGSTFDWYPHSDQPVWGKDVGVITTAPLRKVPQFSMLPSGDVVAHIASTPGEGVMGLVWTRCRAE